MKKLLALSLLSCFAASAAYAGNVTIAGFINQGLQFTKAKGNPASVQLASDLPDSNRIILRGVEDINADYHVGFTLVDKFATDTGNLQVSGKQFLFSQLFIATPIGRFGAGRLAPFGAAVSPIGEWADMTPFGATYGDAGPQGVYDLIVGDLSSNTIYFMSTPVYGFRLGLLMSLTGKNDDEGRKFSEDTQLYDIFLAYEDGPLIVKADVTAYRYGSNSAGYNSDIDNPLWAKLGVKYRFQPNATFYFGFGYGRNQTKYNVSCLGMGTGLNPGNVAGAHGRGIDSYSGNIGVDYPMVGGTLMAAYQIQMGKNNFVEDGKKSFGRHTFGLGYKYPLSKRTNVFGSASYALTTGLLKDTALNRYEIMAGLEHRF